MPEQLTRIPALLASICLIGACGVSGNESSGQGSGDPAGDEAAVVAQEQAPLIVQSGDLDIDDETGQIRTATDESETASDDEVGIAVADEADGDTVTGGEETPFSPILGMTVEMPDGAVPVGLATFTVVDVSVSDAPIEVARAEVPSGSLSGAAPVELFVPLPLDGTIQLAATVLIDADGNGVPSSGDWAPVTPTPVAPGSNLVSIVVEQLP